MTGTLDDRAARIVRHIARILARHRDDVERKGTDQRHHGACNRLDRAPSLPVRYVARAVVVLTPTIGKDHMADKPATKRLHKATYATDKRKGGYLIRVAGPTAGAFVGREVPVTTRAGDEHTEKLIRLIWSGVDTESGDPVALYAFESRPREETTEDTLPF